MLAYSLLISFVAIFHLQATVQRYAIFSTLFFVSALAAAPVVGSISKELSDSAAVTFLDVGHGSAILVQLPSNANILLDGGNAGGDHFDIGAQVIGPYLWNQQIRRLTAVIISHPHADHYNGLFFILRHFKPKTLWINGFSGPDRDYNQLLDLAQRLDIETRIAHETDMIYQAGCTSLICLHGAKGKEVKPADNILPNIPDINDSSLVLRLETNRKTFLFTGDISGKLEKKLVADGKNLPADILMAPHHGSASSLEQTFIETVAPDYIAVSAGRGNLFHFPAARFRKLQRQGIEILTTRDDGTLIFEVTDGRVKVRTYQIN